MTYSESDVSIQYCFLLISFLSLDSDGTITFHFDGEFIPVIHFFRAIILSFLVLSKKLRLLYVSRSTLYLFLFFSLFVNEMGLSVCKELSIC